MENHLELVKEWIENGEYVIAEIAPAIRVTFSEAFNLERKDYSEKICGILKYLGFKKVFETPLGADIIARAEAKHLAEQLGKSVVFNSCCVGWREFAKKRFPEIVKKIALVVSPMMAVGLIAKEIFAKENGLGKVKVVGVMPCNLKKLECNYEYKPGEKYVDAVITLNELAEWIKNEKIDPSNISNEKMDFLLPSESGVGFGATGGVAKAVFSYLSSMLKEKIDLEFTEEALEIKEITIKGEKYKVGKAFGYPMIGKMLEEIDEKFIFVEIMACPFGCVGGEGNPKPKEFLKTLKERAEWMKKIAKERKRKVLEEEKIQEVVEKIEDYLFVNKW